MKSFVFSFFLLCGFFVDGQTTRYVYETIINPDTINLVDMKIERTFLDVKGSKSLFISENKLKQDSIFSRIQPEENIDSKKLKKERKNTAEKKLDNITKSLFFENYILKKHSDNPDIILVESVGSRQIYYAEDRPIVWNILSQKENTDNSSLQKAITSFAGRTWTAWFTTDIKVSDGPYKFSGLPGLILKLEDDRGDYKFNFIKKIEIPNAFEETLHEDAKKSTRINFNSDKVSLMMELNKDKRNSNNDVNMPLEKGGGRMNGGMPPNGMKPNETQQPSNGEFSETSENKNSGFIGKTAADLTNSNPIELKNK